MKSATTIIGELRLANPPDKQLLAQHRAAIVAAQTKCPGPRKTRGECEAKLDEVRADIAAMEKGFDPLNDGLCEKLQARKTQLRLIEDRILALDAEIEAAEHALRLELGNAVNLAVRPALTRELATVLETIAAAIRPLCHDDEQVLYFAHQLPPLADFETFAGCSWWDVAPLEQATAKALALLDTLAAGRNPFTFANGL